MPRPILMAIWLIVGPPSRLVPGSYCSIAMDVFRSSEAVDHLISVARCPIMVDCLTGRTPDHPCADLVLSQWPKEVPVEARAQAWPRWHQLPEPWAGHLRTAPLLFVASNPGYAGKPIPVDGLDGRASDHITTWERDDSEITRRRITALGDAALNAVPYWRDTHPRAVEAFGREVNPGVDYALTEAARCKSKDETVGVASARNVCARNYLHATILLSGARVVLGMGVHAREALGRVLKPLDDGKTDNFFETVIGPRRFLVGLLPHPGAHIPIEKKTLAYNLEKR